MTPTEPAPASASALWRFSLRFYALPGVAPACIELQDNAGVDVNLLLYLLFVAGHGRTLDRDGVARADAQVSAWRDGVVRPLRALRRGMKPGIESTDAAAAERLRGEIKRAELEAERIEQDALERLAGGPDVERRDATPLEAARANVAAYAQFLGGLPGQPVAVLLEAYAAAQRNDRSG